MTIDKKELDLIRELRKSTDANLLDCRIALHHAGGDIIKAIDILREKQTKKSTTLHDRVVVCQFVMAINNLLAMSLENDSNDNKLLKPLYSYSLSASLYNHVIQTKSSYILSKNWDGVGCMLRMGAETDFVTNSDAFVNLLKQIGTFAIHQKIPNKDHLLNMILDNKKSVSEELAILSGAVKEKIEITGFDCLMIKNGVVFSYVHKRKSDTLGDMGILLSVKCEFINEGILHVLREICIHVVAMPHIALNIEGIPTALLLAKKLELKEKYDHLNKSNEMKEKIINEAFHKWCGEVVLLEQPFFSEEKNPKKIKEMLKECGEKNGTQLELSEIRIMCI